MQPIDENSATSPLLNLPAATPPARRFFSFRWRVMLPIVAVLMAVLMCGTYGLSSAFIRQDSRDESETEIIAVSRAVAENAVQIGAAQRKEVDRITFTEGVGQGIVEKNGFTLQPLIEPLAALGNLDLVLVGDNKAEEVIGLQRVEVQGSVDYEVTEKSDLVTIRAVQSILSGADSASEIVSVNRRTMLVTAGPVLQNGQVVGVVLVGMDVNRVMNDLTSGNTGEVALYVTAGRPLTTTLSLAEPTTLDGEIYTHALAEVQNATVEQVTLQKQRYQVAYFPFIVGQTPLGVLAVYQADNSSFAASSGQRLLSLFLALVMGAVCIVAYGALGRQLKRMERLRHKVDRMTAGEDTQTHMLPRDELGAVGAAVDRFAAAARVQVKQMQGEIRQQRRQLVHLHAIFESLNDGLIIQDHEGRVMSMNAAARTLLGAYGTSEGALAVRAWASQAHQRVEELAIGLFALQETTNLEVNGRILRARVAQVESLTEKIMGKVITLQDVTEDFKRQAQRDHLVDEISQNVHVSMTQRAQILALESVTQPVTAQYDAMQLFATEIAHDARSMQRMITEYRDLTLLRPDELRQRQHPVNVLDLLTVVLEEWQPAASIANINLTVNLPDEDDWHVLGDEKRLLQALGNVVDNALKYNEGGGQVLLAAVAQVERSRLVFKVQDEGVGISSEDLPHVFTRFYRGKPLRRDGQTLEVVGTGQGLFLAQKIIEAHGGELVLASLRGQGTQVSVVLPLTAELPLDLANLDTAPHSAVADTAAHSLWDMPTNVVLDQSES